MGNIKLNQVQKKFGDVEVIRPLDLEIKNGEFVVFVGPSGCGKSSLRMAVNHLAQEQGASVQGDIQFEGQSLVKSKVNLLQLRRNIGLIFQRPNPFPTSIYKNLDIPLKEHGFCKSERQDRIEASLQDVGLWQEVKGRLKQQSYSLSGGQQ